MKDNYYDMSFIVHIFHSSKKKKKRPGFRNLREHGFFFFFLFFPLTINGMLTRVDCLEIQENVCHNNAFKNLLTS